LDNTVRENQRKFIRIRRMSKIQRTLRNITVLRIKKTKCKKITIGRELWQ
jgi:hypothetical protein